MIDADAVAAIIDQYSRHGWTLRRLLAGDPNDTAWSSVFSDHAAGEMVIEPSEAPIDAAWFSRPAVSGDRVAWEIRSLSGRPFALVTSVDADASDEALKEALAATAELFFEKLA